MTSPIFLVSLFRKKALRQRQPNDKKHTSAQRYFRWLVEYQAQLETSPPKRGKKYD